ncbi:DUF5753 domain-containing protein [Streptomyces atriruber]|uniref:DUF5753 domain-containing protein n=1 Tax=Streptomyces atriruber TaxID=545121 RepID=A0ABV3BJH0_9ACTN
MSDFQEARQILGARLSDLRSEAGMEGKHLAAELGWQPSKVSRLQNGKQTASAADVSAWAAAVGRPDVEPELQGLRAGAELKHRTWRRQLAGGHAERQKLAIRETEATRLIRAFEVARIPGLLQTREYARVIFDSNAAFREIPATTEKAVANRMRRQEALYEPGREFRFLLCEAALYHRSCPKPVMAAQLDRLYGVVGMPQVDLAVIPFGAELRRTAAHSFWIYDRRQVIVETITEELWLTADEDMRLYERAWDWLADSAERGHVARRLIGRARASLELA